MSGRRQIALLLASNVVLAALSGGLAATWMSRKSLRADRASITAREFILADESGHVGAKLTWEEHQPGIRLFDQSGHVRSALFLEPNGVPDLYLYDQNNMVRAALNLFDSGVPNLGFLDTSNEQMVFTEFDNNHSYNLRFVKIGKDANHEIASRRITAGRYWRT
ncbi:MAG TPA: hypothetical protein VKZ53_00515 [Candidatus Angelobacter sp.]|nr:hypothetical protein [Candidatus Angelobacter sp.]